MRYHNFCLSFRANSTNMFRKLRKARKGFFNYDLSSEARKTLLQASKALKITFFLPTSFSDNHGQTSWDTFAFLGRFPIYIGPIPPLTPYTMFDAGNLTQEKL